ncbi:MAG: AAA family ATPase [bacterium]|nr:AAA family ATPase [bacterium]
MTRKEAPEVDDDLSADVGVSASPASGLIEACASGNCVLVAGAGLGISAGYPSWKQYLSRLIDRLGESHTDFDWEELRNMVSRGRSAEAAEIITARVSREEIVALSIDVAGGRTEPEVPTVLATLADIRFRGVVSTTWDRLVQEAFRVANDDVMTPNSENDFTQVLRDPKQFFFKPYGSFVHEESLAFTFDAYRDAVDHNDAYSKFIGAICTMYSLLFMGTSVETIEDFFKNSGVLPSPDRYHFALVPESECSDLERERLLAKYNLKVATFVPSSGWGEVRMFAEDLREFVSAEMTKNVARPPIKAQLLEKLTLENIAPFKSLELDLAPEWTILLGDNGCGKTTILRSIALALAGDADEVQDVAGCLLQSGADSGSIELKIGDSIFRTTLKRVGRKVQARSNSITPVQGGTWLVLGFPALRGAPSRKLKGAVSVLPSSEPSVDDLAPLLKNNVDCRFDDLQQWILNTLISAERSDSDNNVARIRRDAFLSAMRQLTPGITLKRLTYREDPWEVMVVTEDGEIPLRMMSQGMNSIIAWTGMLLRRLSEVYPDTEEPHLCRCLVLNDEIGAHLHPEWQGEVLSLIRGESDGEDVELQRSIKKLRRNGVFPNIQVIATTHSPLIVANAKKGEVFYLTRPDHDSEESSKPAQPVVTRIEHSFEGWRTDQILTAPAFGMAYARDRKTRLLLERYEVLFAKDKLSSTERQQMEMLAQELDQMIIPRKERAEQRQAYKLLNEFMEMRLKKLPEKEKRRIICEAEKLLVEMEVESE